MVLLGHSMDRSRNGRLEPGNSALNGRYRVDYVSASRTAIDSSNPADKTLLDTEIPDSMVDFFELASLNPAGIFEWVQTAKGRLAQAEVMK